MNQGDGGTGTATYVVRCNAVGTAWENDGEPVTAVECQTMAAAMRKEAPFRLGKAH